MHCTPGATENPTITLELVNVLVWTVVQNFYNDDIHVHAALTEHIKQKSIVIHISLVFKKNQHIKDLPEESMCSYCNFPKAFTCIPTCHNILVMALG